MSHPCIAALLSKRFWISLILLIIVYAVCFLWLDQPIATWAHAHLYHTDLAKLSNMIARYFKPSHWAEVAAASLLAGAVIAIKNKSSAKPYLYFGACVIGALIIAACVKYTLARYRPVLFLEHGQYGFHFFSMKRVNNSTPSGHAVAAFAGLYALSRTQCYRWATVLLLAIATLIALSRVVITMHFLSDVILGAYMGIIVVNWLHHIFYGEHYDQPNRNH